LLAAEEPLSPSELSACVKEYAAREKAYRKCLSVITDDAKFKRCRATIDQRPRKRPEVRVCYDRAPAVCLQWLEDIQRKTVRCYKDPPLEAEAGRSWQAREKQKDRLRAAKTCRRLLEDLPQDDRRVRPCRRFQELEDRRGSEQLSALIPRSGGGRTGGGRTEGGMTGARTSGMDGARTDARTARPRNRTAAIARCSRLTAPSRPLAKALGAWCGLDTSFTPRPLGQGPGDNSGGGDVVEDVLLVLLLIAVGAGLIIGVLRYQRARRVMTAPLSDQEREDQQRIPAQIATLSRSELHASLLESASSALVYLDSAQRGTDSTGGLGALGAFGPLNRVGGGARESAEQAVQNDLMQADRLLLEVHQHLVQLARANAAPGGYGRPAGAGTPNSDPTDTPLRWVLDDSLAELSSRRELSRLEMRLRQARETLEQIIGKS
jgi:hypothetical protein